MDAQSLILVVDDQQRSRLAMASLLEPEGYRIEFATTGPEALAQLRLIAPDLILLDVMMPDMDGFEVCRRIRADPALAMIPVVMVTALDDQESLIQGIESGADDFVTKPFNRTELRARVRTITRLNRFRTLLHEQRLVASERAQFLWAIERSVDGYLILNTDGSLLDGNLQGWHYLGFAQRPTAVQGETFLETVRHSYQLQPQEAWDSWPHPTTIPRYLVRPENKYSVLWLKVELFELPEGMLGNCLVHLQDVTLQVTSQRHMWAFHSFVSHKLRTPLTSVLTGMGLLNQRTHLLPPDLAMLTETAYTGIQQLRQVVDDIFRYLDSPVLLVTGNGVDMESLEDLLLRLATLVGINTLLVKKDLGEERCELKVSTHTIELLLTELLENARKFHPQNNPVVEVVLCRSGAKAIISVTDDGVNLTPAQFRQILRPYQQIDDDFTGQVPGIGLGLPTVIQTCWSVGGRCHLENRPDGPGIRVILELPLDSSCIQPDEAVG